MGIVLKLKTKASPPLAADRDKSEREIAVTDKKIDDIVYGLYGITEEERKIIEVNGRFCNAKT